MFAAKSPVLDMSSLCRISNELLDDLQYKRRNRYMLDRVLPQKFNIHTKNGVLICYLSWDEFCIFWACGSIIWYVFTCTYFSLLLICVFQFESFFFLVPCLFWRSAKTLRWLPRVYCNHPPVLQEFSCRCSAKTWLVSVFYAELEKSGPKFETHIKEAFLQYKSFHRFFNPVKKRRLGLVMFVFFSENPRCFEFSVVCWAPWKIRWFGCTQLYPRKKPSSKFVPWNLMVDGLCARAMLWFLGSVYKGVRMLQICCWKKMFENYGSVKVFP